MPKKIHDRPKIPIPDLRIEYVNENDNQIQHRDLELATDHYRPRGLSEKVEHIATIGLVRKFPKDKDVWRELDRLGLGVRINDTPAHGHASFHSLAEHYLKADFGADAVRPKSPNTIPIVEHYVRDYLIKRFGQQIAEDIKPLEIQKWFKFLNETGGLAWTTIAKMRGLMHRIASTRSASCTNTPRRIP